MVRFRFLAGLILLALGIVLMLDQIGYASAGVVLAAWWPLVIVALGLAFFAASPRSFLAPGLITFVGIWLLLGSLGLLTALTIGLLGPALIVLVGIALLFGRGPHFFNRSDRGGDVIDQLALFSGLELHPVIEKVRGGSLAALFGGITLDLQHSTLAADGAHLQALAAFGGVTVLVPEGWLVTISGLPVFGGYSNRTNAEGLALSPAAPHLHLDVLVLFGGVEVKNIKPESVPLSPAA